MRATTVHDLSPDELARLADRLMRRQAALSLRVAAVFAVLILGLPLVNAYLPDLADARVGGFPASWLFLGVLFYPITVALSFYFVRHSDRIEAESADWRAVLDDGAGPGAESHDAGGAAR